MAVGWPRRCAGGHEELGEGRECVFVTLAFKSGEADNGRLGGSVVVARLFCSRPRAACGLSLYQTFQRAGNGLGWT